MAQTFKEIVSDILESDNFKQMKEYRHHGSISTYKHSITVAFLVYKHYKDKNTKYDLKDIVRGAILHDYYLYDWHHTGEGHRLHGFRHPYFAYKNAKKEYEISYVMKDIIIHHMFPLVIIPPKTKPGWVVSYYDKVASRHDYKRHKMAKRLKRKRA